MIDIIAEGKTLADELREEGIPPKIGIGVFITAAIFLALEEKVAIDEFTSMCKDGYTAIGNWLEEHQEKK